MVGVLERIGETTSARPLPPVHLWNPSRCGEIDIVIEKNGLWRHEGTPIGRETLVRLFSTILRKDPDGFHLVTPVEKLKIRVEDAPFLAVGLKAEGGALRFTTNVGDEVVAGPKNGIRVTTDPASGEPRPYLHVRAGLEALIVRSVFYELAELASDRDLGEGAQLAVGSQGVWFALAPAGAHLS